MKRARGFEEKDPETNPRVTSEELKQGVKIVGHPYQVGMYRAESAEDVITTIKGFLGKR